jgi:hypothetical protein
MQKSKAAMQLRKSRHPKHISTSYLKTHSLTIHNSLRKIKMAVEKELDRALCFK